MIERLMTGQRKLVATVLISLLSIMLLLWFIREPRPAWSNVAFFTVSTVLVPLAYFGIYGILHLSVRMNHISDRALRWACGLFFVGAVAFLAASVALTIHRFATHRTIPPPNFVALGVALGAMKSWGLQGGTAVRE